jgi:ketosteroid isomerase-like protein
MEKKQTYKNEIVEVEAAFAESLRSEGMKAAFLSFAAEDAVLNRNDVLYKGKEEIRAYLEGISLLNIRLEWEPEYIDVSGSGDMAYTYGPYTFSAEDTAGNAITATGIFHTVWKRQEDGSWKYVWD